MTIIYGDELQDIHDLMDLLYNFTTSHTVNVEKISVHNPDDKLLGKLQWDEENDLYIFEPEAK